MADKLQAARDVVRGLYGQLEKKTLSGVARERIEAELVKARAMRRQLLLELTGATGVMKVAKPEKTEKASKPAKTEKAKTPKAVLEARIEAVTARKEGDHVRCTSGHGWWKVQKSKTGKWYCSCPAWRFQKTPAEQRTCKHLEAARRAGLLD